MVAEAGAGPDPIPYRSLTSQKLIQAIQLCLSPDAVRSARKLADAMHREDGVQAAVDAFHANLPQSKMGCDFFSDQPAALVYGRGKKQVKMCRPVASILVKNGKLQRKQLKLYVNTRSHSPVSRSHLIDTVLFADTDRNQQTSKTKDGTP